MKLSRDCGLSFGVLCTITCLLEVVLSGLVITLSGWAWISEGKPTHFFYSHNPKDSYIVRNKSLEGCVVLWCLSVICVIGIWRILSAGVLVISAKKRSVGCAQYWIIYKGVVLAISSFVAISSFTAPQIKLSALASLTADVITGYFIVILYPEIDRMQRTITVLPEDSQKERPKSIEA